MLSNEKRQNYDVINTINAILLTNQQCWYRKLFKYEYIWETEYLLQTLLIGIEYL